MRRAGGGGRGQRGKGGHRPAVAPGWRGCCVRRPAAQRQNQVMRWAAAAQAGRLCTRPSACEQRGGLRCNTRRQHLLRAPAQHAPPRSRSRTSATARRWTGCAHCGAKRSPRPTGLPPPSARSWRPLRHGPRCRALRRSRPRARGRSPRSTRRAAAAAAAGGAGVRRARARWRTLTRRRRLSGCRLRGGQFCTSALLPALAGKASTRHRG